MSTLEQEELITPTLLQDCLADDTLSLECLKNYLSTVDEMLNRAFLAGRRVDALVHARAHSIDLLLQHLWEHFGLDRCDTLSLIAVGGYGRGELHPFSDIDILVLHTQLDGHFEKAIADFVTFLWDLGLKPGHAVRSMEECEALAREDITVITTLLESRWIAGMQHLLDELRYLINEHNMWDVRAYYQSKRQEQAERHKKFHSTSYAIEPNLKESPGGLRDIQNVSWIAKRHFKASGLYELTHLGVFSVTEFRTLSSCLVFLWKVRYALHLVAGRAEERLLFEYQKQVAEMLGYKGRSENAAVELFMKKYFRTVMKIRDLNDLLLQVFEQELLQDKSKKLVKKIDHQFQIQANKLQVCNTQVFANDPSALLRIFKVFVESKTAWRLSPTTLRLITANKKLIDNEFRNDEANQKLFIDFFKAKGNLARALTLFKRTGILGAYLPAFAKIAGQMQFDMFHIYTVDEHTLFLLRNIAQFTETDDETFPLCREIMLTTEHPEIVFLAGLFHDIAKGRGGDHSTLGAMDAANFCEAHRIPKAHADIVVWLVEYHLLMSVTAQKKDIFDPQVVHEFAEIVGTVQRLEFLYVLTVADIRATNPTLWNGWKDALLRDLFLATREALKADEIQEVDWQAIIEETKSEALLGLKSAKVKEDAVQHLWTQFNDDYFQAHKAEQIIWHTENILKLKQPYKQPGGDAQAIARFRKSPDADALELFVFFHDKAHIFAGITTFLAEKNIAIQAASIHTSDIGRCIDSFVLLPNPYARNQDINQLALELQAYLNQLDQKVRIFSPRLSRALQNFSVETRVTFDNDPENRFTTLELHALERPGLLALVSQAFIRCEVRLLSAKIVTLGERVEDIFTICDYNDNAITDKAWQQRIKDAIVELLDDGMN